MAACITDVSTLFGYAVDKYAACNAIYNVENQTYITYEVLKSKVDLFSRNLRLVAGNVIIASFVDQGWEQVVTVLGTMIAGFTYLPLVLLKYGYIYGGVILHSFFLFCKCLRLLLFLTPGPGLSK